MSNEVPGRFHCAIGGHPYILDLSFEPYRRDAFRSRSIPSNRPPSDIGNIPGENSINTQGLWRRAGEDWFDGAGQEHFDRHTSDNRRFRQSKGIDPFTHPWQLKLLPDTQLARPSVYSTLQLAVVGNYLYVLDGAGIYWTSDVTPTTGATWTQVTGLAGTVSSITSDGANLWVACGSSGVYQVTPATNPSTASSYNALSCTLIAYARGRLMAASGASIYNIVSTSTPTALWTHPISNWTWIGFAEAQDRILLAGYAGDKSAVYGCTIVADGTSLSVPTLALALPSGEIISSVTGYLGYCVLGSQLGVRFCHIDNSLADTATGTLVSGSIIPLSGQPCLCAEGQSSFIRFGWTDYDGVSTGLGRMNLQQQTQPDTPAYASDLMAPGAGPVCAIATFQSRTVFAVGGQGVYAQAATYVASGTIDTGYIIYGIPDPKVAHGLQVNTIPDSTQPTMSVEGFVSVDRGALVAVGTHSYGALNNTDVNGVWTLPQLRGREFEVRLQLNASADLTDSPVVNQWILKALPGVASGTMISATLTLASTVNTLNDDEYHYNIDDEYNFLEGLRQTQQVVTYQQGYRSYSVTVDSIDDLPYVWESEQKTFHTVTIVYLKTVSG
jgi:hypothetical protein